VSVALILGCLWFVAANIVAMLPSRDHHWTAAYMLIACGVPLLGWLTVEHGPILGMLALAAGASILRWPLVFLMRRIKGLAMPPHHQDAAE